MKEVSTPAGCAEVGTSVVPNRDRTARTRAALLDAARSHFVAQGYGATSTPEIVRTAGITRGALYHHFADKRDIFRAVLVREMQAVADEIRGDAHVGMHPLDALLAGTHQYLQAMSVPGRTRLLLVEGPAVLGWDEMHALDGEHAARTLAEGLAAAGVAPRDISLACLVPLLSAMFDRAALAVDAGATAQDQETALAWVLRRLVEAPSTEAR